MNTATVKVAFVNQPKPGRKQGSIKTEEGTYIGVWPEQLSKFKPGGTYEIEYETNEKGYHTMKRLVGGDIVPPTAGQALNKTSSFAKGSDTKAVEMVVMGIVGRAHQSTGTLPDEDTLYGQMLAVRAAWTRAFAAPLGPVPDASKLTKDELNDEIPF